MSTTEETKPKRTIVGEVLSDKMDKTVVVRVDRAYMHPRLKKVVRVAKNFKVHDEKEQAKVGDVVEFYEGRPTSKTKFMYLYRVVRSAPSA